MASVGLLLVQHSGWYLPVTGISNVLRGNVLFYRGTEHLEVSVWMSKGADLQFVSYSVLTALVPAFNLLINAMQLIFFFAC